jgi:hypothetical protein
VLSLEESINPTPQELLQLGTSSAAGQLDRLKIANGGNVKTAATNHPALEPVGFIHI